jgi:hypothetical protein
VKHCEFKANCPIFAKFSSTGSRDFWIHLYCQGVDQEHCARKVLRKEGRPVPITLLPNGKHLPELAAEK